jgi:hypothetical protein
MEIPEDAARHLVGPAADHYLAQWSRLDTRRGVLGFSWVGFLFGPYWMLYRRMYRTCGLWMGAVLLWGVAEALAVALLHLPQPSVLFDGAVDAGIGATCGVFGSYWYYLETRRRYRRLMMAGTRTPDALARAGGVSRSAVWIGVLITVVLALLYVIGTAASHA